MHATLPLLQVTEFPAINRDRLTTLQVNLGYKCNQTCVHCHVNAGPNRKEMMDAENLSIIPEVLKARGIETLDLTGGAPELHEGFRQVVVA
ncbi:MAG: radical SAM protein, partial [Gammaproteobacteria bacterium]